MLTELSRTQLDSPVQLTADRTTDSSSNVHSIQARHINDAVAASRMQQANPGSLDQVSLRTEGLTTLR